MRLSLLFGHQLIAYWVVLSLVPLFAMSMSMYPYTLRHVKKTVK